MHRQPLHAEAAYISRFPHVDCFRMHAGDLYQFPWTILKLKECRTLLSKGRQPKNTSQPLIEITLFPLGAIEYIHLTYIRYVPAENQTKRRRAKNAAITAAKS